MGPQIQLEAEAARQRSAGIVTVDLLPVESRVSTYEDDQARVEAVGSAYCLTVMSGMVSALYKRGYRLAGFIDRVGHYSDRKVRRAMTEEEVSAALVEFGTHAETQLRSPKRLVPLTLHSNPGRPTGSQGTIYVGGDVYVGDERFDRADFLATLALINTVATVAATVAQATSGDRRDRQLRASETAVNGMETTTELVDAADAAAEARPAPKFPSHLRLVLTMVDNQTGSILWHSDRTFPFNPSSRDRVQRALELSLREMPRGGAR